MKTVPMLFLLFILIEQVEAEEIQSTHSLKPIKLSAEEEFKKEHKVEKQFIEKANTLGDAIKHVSGVQSSSFGPNSGAPVIRGLQGNRVGVFENGTSIQGLNAISGNVNIPFDPIFTESIKINKSSNSVRYGDQSLGGSVEVDSGLIPKEIPEKSRELDLVLKKGWNNFDAKGLKLQLSNQTNLATNIRFSRQEIKSYKIPGKSKADVCESEIFRNGGVNSSLADVCQKDSRIKSTYNKASQPYIDQFITDNPDYADGDFSYYTDNATSTFGGKVYQNIANPDYVQGTERFKHENINNDVTPNYNKKLGNSYAINDNIALGTTYFLENGYIGFSADYKKSHYGVPGFSMENKSFQTNYDDGLPVGVKTEQNTFLLDSLFNQPLPFLDNIQFKASNLVNKSGEYIGASEANLYEFEQNFAEFVVKQKELKFLSGEMGLSWGQRDVHGKGYARYLPNVKTNKQAFFIQEKLSFNPIYFDAGYRKEKVEHQIQDQTFVLARNANNQKLENRDFDLTQFYVGAGLNWGEHVHIYAKYSESERAPEINELYSSNPHYSVMTQEEGNQNLEKEKVKAMELNTDFVFDQSKIQLSLYQMNFTNYVYLMHSGMAMGNRLPLKYWRQTDIKIDGFEIDLSHKFLLDQWGDLTLSAFGDFVKNRVKDTKKLQSSNDGEYPTNMPTNRYGASLEWEKDDYHMRLSNIYYAKPQYLGKSVNAEVALPAYNLLDLSFSKKVALKNADVELYLNGTNLLNEEARPQNSPLKYIAPLPGRGLQLGITMSL